MAPRSPLNPNSFGAKQDAGLRLGFQPHPVKVESPRKHRLPTPERSVQPCRRSRLTGMWYVLEAAWDRRPCSAWRRVHSRGSVLRTGGEFQPAVHLAWNTFAGTHLLERICSIGIGVDALLDSRTMAGKAGNGAAPAGLPMAIRRQVYRECPEAPSEWDRLGKILRLSAPFQDRSRTTFRIGGETMPGSDAGRVLIDPAPRPRTTPARPRSWRARTMRLSRRQSGDIRRGGTSRVRSGTSAAPECPAPGGQRAGR